MSYTITHAQFSNSEGTAAVITTEEAGPVFITPADADLWAQMLEEGTPASAPNLDAGGAAVPASVTPRQARLALYQAGRLADVTAAIEAMPEPQRSAAQIEWEFASSVERASPLVATLGAALSLTEEDLDALFVTAGGL